MWCVMNKCQNQLVCYGLYPSSACFCHFQKQDEENKISACMAKHAENVAIFKSLTKSEQSERSKRKNVLAGMLFNFTKKSYLF